MNEKVFWGKGMRRVLCLMFCLAVCLLLMPMTAHADDDEHVECEHCGEMRWGDWKCEEGDHCAVGYGCGDKNHCKECGACHTDDDDWCEYCGICFECNPKCEGCSRVIGDRRCVECCDDGSHCPECNESYYDVGLWCAECFRCFDNCVDQCEACSDYEGTEICVECGIEKGNHCEHCGECFVMNPDAWYECDNCDRCALCGDGICDSCGLCYVCLEDIETHCQNCGTCNYDAIICQECGDVCSDCVDDFCEYCEMCLGCALTLGLHCPTCGSCGESEVGICPVCEAVCTACVAFCDDCEMCVDCATTVYQRHCTECGECVTNVDICQVCGLCSECTGEICYICGLCRTDANQFGFHCLSCGACATEEKNCPVCGNAVKEAVFTSHPGGGVSLAGKPYTIHFSNKLAEQKVYLEKYDSATGRWVFSDDDYTIVDWGTTSYEIPYGTPGKTDRYRLYMQVGYHEVYSKEFEVTWSNNIFKKQPVEGWTRLNADYQIAFAVNDYATDATFELQYKIPNKNMWDTEAMIESPYTYTIPGKSTEEAWQYRILCTYNGHKFYSNEFVVMWRKTLHSHTYLARWSKDVYGHWHSANCSDSGIKDLAAHGIKDFAVHTPGPAANGTNPQTCTVCGYIITPAPIVNKENLLKAPESIAFGSRLEVNTDVIETDDDFIEGYLEGNITWVFTSVSGNIRTYRFTRDPEYFMVTKDMYHGSVHCEVYNSKETVAWVSQEISFDNVHNFSSATHSCTICGEKDPAYAAAPEITKQPVNVTAAAGETAIFSVTATGEGLTYQWQYRNAGASDWSSSKAAAAKTANMTFVVGTDSTLNGRQYRCVVTDKNGNSVTSNAATLTVKATLAITSQPTNQTAAVGATVSFKVTATGDGLTYQWQYRNAGASDWSSSKAAAAKTADMNFVVGTDSTLNGRQYRCIVTDKYGKSVTSNAATLTVSTSAAGLAITTQPADQTAAVGATVSFKVAATGEGLTYQWQYRNAGASDWSSSKAAAAKTAEMSFVVGTDKTLNGRQYRCIVTDKNGNSVTSNAATLTVSAGDMNPLSISIHPADETATAGAKVSFTVAAIGEGLTYQWQYRNAGASDWSNSGAAAAKTANMTFAVGTDKALNGREYRCIVTDKNGNKIISNAATLTVGVGPVITSQPVNRTAAVGASVSFKVAATGEGLTYQWQYRNAGASTWSNSGAAAAKTANMTFTVGTDKSLNGRQYRCIVTDKNGNKIISNAVTLTVSAGPVITSQPANQTAAAGAKVSFTVAAAGEGLTYQWQYRNAGASTWTSSGVAAAKTANMSFTVGTDKTLNGRQYRCIVTDKNGKTVTSNAATLTVK